MWACSLFVWYLCCLEIQDGNCGSWWWFVLIHVLCWRLAPITHTISQWATRSLRHWVCPQSYWQRHIPLSHGAAIILILSIIRLTMIFKIAWSPWQPHIVISLHTEKLYIFYIPLTGLIRASQPNRYFSAWESLVSRTYRPEPHVVQRSALMETLFVEAC